MKYDTYTLEVCSDCYYATEYGCDAIDDLTPERKARIDAGFDQWKDTTLHASGNDDPSFVHTSCDICHMSEGHMAYQVIAMIPAV